MSNQRLIELLRRPLLWGVLAANLVFLSPGIAAESEISTKEEGVNQVVDINKATQVEDLAYGNILFEYYRGNDIEALNAILVADKRGSLPNQRQNARLLSGVIYLDLGMLVHAQTIFNQLLSEDDLKSEIVAKLEFYLGKLHYQQGDLQQAKFRLGRIIESLEYGLQDEGFIILGNIAMLEGDKLAAEKWLSRVSSESELIAFSRYNLGVLWLKEGLLEKAEPQLATIANSATDIDIVKSLQDKAQLALGYYFLASKDLEKARNHFRQIRLKSAASNKALLGIGWSYLENYEYKKALAHWNELSQRDIRDIAVQEALLAIPYAYQKLDSMQLSLDNYVRASDVYQQQINLIDELISRVEDGQLIDNLVAHIMAESTQSITDDGVQDSRLLGGKYDYYLYELISQHDFNQRFRSYQKLGKLSQLLAYWKKQLPIFDEILRANKIRFEEKLPQVRKYLAQGAFEQYEADLRQFELDIQELKKNQKLHLLADEEQLEIYERLSRLEEKLAKIPADSLPEGSLETARRAKGVFQWQLESNKVGKIWALEKQALLIRAQLEQVQGKRDNLERARDKAAVRFDGYQDKVDIGKGQLLGLREKIEAQIELQVEELKKQIIMVLRDRRENLDYYLLQSDLSIARLHEKAVVIPELE